MKGDTVIKKWDKACTTARAGIKGKITQIKCAGIQGKINLDIVCRVQRKTGIKSAGIKDMYIKEKITQIKCAGLQEEKKFWIEFAVFKEKQG